VTSFKNNEDGKTLTFDNQQRAISQQLF